MSDAAVTLDYLKLVMADFVKQRDWQQFHSPKNLVMGLAIETAELMEHFQWLDSEASRAVTADPGQMNLIREEIADVFSYVLCLANTMGIDLSEAYFAKMERNELKYPADKFRGRYKL